jgi:hypothetical protein
MSLPTFSSNYTADGKLFKRKHGYSFEVEANSLVKYEIKIPYKFCKLDKVEIIGCSMGDSVSFKILDDDAGTYTTIPKQQINQYGFNVKLNDKYYEDQCKYEANLLEGLYILVEYQENNNASKTIYLNLDLHEVIK